MCYTNYILEVEDPKSSLAGRLVGPGNGLFDGGFNHPGVGQDSLGWQSVHRAVLQQPGNQVFCSVADVNMSRVGILHLGNKESDEVMKNCNAKAPHIGFTRCQAALCIPLISCGRYPHGFLLQKEAFQLGIHSRGHPDSTGLLSHRGFFPQSSPEASNPVFHTGLISWRCTGLTFIDN